MKIRDKLLLAFSLYIFLAVILGSFAYKELLTITKRLALVEVADDITNALLEVRRYEKNFLLFKDNESLKELKEYLGVLKKNTDNIEVEIVREVGSQNYAAIKEEIAEYERFINNVVDNFKSQEELQAILIDRGRKIERRLSGKELQVFLVLRRYEKNLIIYKNQITYETFIRTFNAMHPDKDSEIARYRVFVDKLYDLYNKEKHTVEEMRATARKIQSFTENMSKKERVKIDSILEMSTRLLLFALLSVVVLGTIVNLKLAMSIVTPLRKLERITNKIANGDFSESIQVTGEDEIASLSISFNQMEEKLRDSMNSLEYAIEKLQEKQAQLVAAEKLASVGILAAGIAHEINNPLTSVLTFSNLMLEQCPPDDPRHEKLKLMARETERARNIVRQLLSFAKEAPIKLVRIDLNRQINEVVDSLKAQGAFKDIELVVGLSEDIPEMRADPALIGQVILNMLLNAIHAIVPPGRIEIATRHAEGLAEITISDTGRGIPEDHIGKIFDPFFTTKEVNKGTGLGLAVSYGIIKKHGGNIDVTSTLGKGTTFIVKLPVKAVS